MGAMSYLDSFHHVHSSLVSKSPGLRSAASANGVVGGGRGWLQRKRLILAFGDFRLLIINRKVAMLIVRVCWLCERSSLGVAKQSWSQLRGRHTGEAYQSILVV